MKFVKYCFVFVVFVLVGVGFRYVVKRFAPGMYDAFYGVRVVTVHTPQSVSGGAAKPAGPIVASVGEVPELPMKKSVESGDGLPPAVYVTGILRRGDRVIVVMSDGTVRTDEDNVPGRQARLTYLTRTFVEWDGQRYWLTPKFSGQQEDVLSARSSAQQSSPRAQTGGPIAGPSS